MAFVTTVAGTAGAQVTYDFSTSLAGYNGAASGNWTGYFTLNWLSSGGSGTGAASTFITTAMPTGVATPAQGWDATLFNVIGANSFTVTNGTITGLQFGAVSEPDNFVVCANSGSQFTLNVYLICPAQYNRVGVANSARGDNFGGLSAFTFTARPATSVPEPASVGLLLGGMAGLVTIARRRRA